MVTRPQAVGFPAPAAPPVLAEHLPLVAVARGELHPMGSIRLELWARCVVSKRLACLLIRAAFAPAAAFFLPVIRQPERPIRVCWTASEIPRFAAIARTPAPRALRSAVWTTALLNAPASAAPRVWCFAIQTAPVSAKSGWTASRTRARRYRPATTIVGCQPSELSRAS